MDFKNSRSYHFNYVQACNMCKAPADGSKILGIRLNTRQGLRPKSVIGLGVSVLQCSNCRLIYSSPQPIPHNIDDHYGVSPDDYWEPDYFSGEAHSMDYHVPIINRLMQIKPGAKSLDIGTGVGFSMLELEKMGFDSYGIEPSSSFVKYAIEKVGIKPEKIVVGMMEDGNFEKESFDFILIRVVLEHVYDPASCIEQAMTWLKPDGIMHIEVPSSNHLISKFFNLYFRLVGTNYVTNLSPAHAPYHLHEFSADSFRKHGERANYDVVFEEHYPAEVFFFPRFTHSFFKWVMRKTNTGMQLAVWLKKRS